jgi:hypothetical protein
MMAFYRFFGLFTPLETILSASISKPESVSSKNFGSNIAIWKISLRFFSPPENLRLASGTKLSIDF